MTKFVLPACLWPHEELHKDSMLEGCGFGQTEYGGPISSVLNKFLVSPVNKSECSFHYENVRKLPNGIIDSHFCAQDRSSKRMDACNVSWSLN